MSSSQNANVNMILSPGTQVVTSQPIVDGNRILHPVGAVGVVIKSPADLQHRYRVRFPDGVEESLLQNQIVMLSHYEKGNVNELSERQDSDLFDRVILRCVIGSRAYGLEDEQSDIDYRGIYLPTAEQHWSLSGVPEQIDCNATQESYWEVQKFVILALKSNPSVLECLYSPMVEKATPLAEGLLAIRDSFLSKLVYQTFNGYVMSQFKKMQADIRNKGSVKWKHVMHLLRLLITGTRALREHTISVRVDDFRERLMAVKTGTVLWEETEEWRLALHAEFNAACESTTLPDRPDYQKANQFLIRARKAAQASELP